MEKKKTKVGFISLGCSKNLMDTEVMLGELNSAGYEITPEETEADIIILNTWSFIKDAKTEAVDNILDIAWLKDNASLKGLIVCGCLVQRYGEEILSEFPEVDAILSVGAIHEIADAVKAVENGEKYVSVKPPEQTSMGGDRIVTTPEHYAYMKIAEGCDNRCTYCAIPNIRGKFRSRPMEDLIKEAKDMEKLGVRELILVAQDTTRYGQDLYGEYKLAELIHSISEQTYIPWIRVLYCYPDKITEELLDEFKNNERLVKYIDIPIQHINDDVLKKMNRHGGKEAIVSSIKKLRGISPYMTIRSTVIVGFPGETEEQFSELLAYLKEARFDRLGVFEYSKEEGTPAEKFKGQVSKEKKAERYKAVTEQQAEIVDELNAEKEGQIVKVLIEGYDPVSESYYSRSYADAPEIDGKIYITGAPKNAFSPGDFADVKIYASVDCDLVAEIYSGSKHKRKI